MLILLAVLPHKYRIHPPLSVRWHHFVSDTDFRAAQDYSLIVCAYVPILLSCCTPVILHMPPLFFPCFCWCRLTDKPPFPSSPGTLAIPVALDYFSNVARPGNHQTVPLPIPCLRFTTRDGFISSFISLSSYSTLCALLCIYYDVMDNGILLLV